MTIAPNQYVIEADFRRDLGLLVLLHLKGLVSEIPNDPSLKEIFLRWQSVMGRRLPAQPRQVVMSKESSTTLACPSGNKYAFDRFCERARKGQYLLTSLSGFYADINFQDPWLNQMGIMHIHLGKPDNSDVPLPDPSGPLLFARITQKEFYVIGTGTRYMLSNQTLMQILKENWPDSLSVRDARAFGANPDDISTAEPDGTVIAESIRALDEIEASAKDIFLDFLSAGQGESMASRSRPCVLRLKHIDQQHILFSVDGSAADQVPVFMMEIDKPLPMLN